MHLLTSRDSPALTAAANFPSIESQLRDGFPSPYTLADAEAFLSRPKPSDGSALLPTHLGIFLKSGNFGNMDGPEPRLIGGIGFIISTNVGFRTWELGYWFTPDVWRNGYGLEAVKAMTDFAFTTWPELNRIEAVPYSSNIASRNLLLKAGFKEEGIKRGSVFKSGKFQDHNDPTVQTPMHSGNDVSGLQVCLADVEFSKLILQHGASICLARSHAILTNLQPDDSTIHAGDSLQPSGSGSSSRPSSNRTGIMPGAVLGAAAGVRETRRRLRWRRSGEHRIGWQETNAASISANRSQGPDINQDDETK
ncbi:hypothetical protein NQ176_g6151 [Zarea fungicola]|uniref:Uncharacterized protein n=1 Tax=Zarea fungicola TaxID=93591 RepID=A0ACC1N4R6_9HYPO|nr:hypothetical protein NQ176_g6151 [Lecanicillium fungicola]